MTKLEEYITKKWKNHSGPYRAYRYDEIEAMNILQDNGIISDCAVWARDVATVDEDAAIAFLESNYGKI